MTGAPIPLNTEAVVQVERTKSLEDGRVQIDDPGLKAGQNLLARGREMRAGEVVVPRGTVIRPQEIGVLATVGRGIIKAIPRPIVAVLATGDELVEANQKPGPGQIRNGNGPTLVAQITRTGAVPRYLGIAQDRVDSLRQLITKGLQSDVLLLSGGVSAGKLDLVPDVLRELGVEAHFHKVEMKPGKPIFFGTWAEKEKGVGSLLPERPEGCFAQKAPDPFFRPSEKTLVFGLPGNPVSTFLCFELFVRPALRVLRGFEDPGTTLDSATLAQDYAYRTDRPTYHPAWLDASAPGSPVKVVPWFGSPDLRGLTHCNCFVLLPAGDLHHRAGQSFPVLRMEACDA